MANIKISEHLRELVNLGQVELKHVSGQHHDLVRRLVRPEYHRGVALELVPGEVYVRQVQLPQRGRYLAGQLVVGELEAAEFRPRGLSKRVRDRSCEPVPVQPELIEPRKLEDRARDRSREVVER